MNLQTGLESSRRAVLVGILLFLGSLEAISQDSVDVIFRFKPPVSSQPYLVGEFNGWKPADQSLKLNYQGSDWIITKRLPIGGNPFPPSNGVASAWQFKFYYAQDWTNDPLDHHVNARDNNNSYLYTKDPTIYQLLPNQRSPLVQSNTPTVSAYIFPKVGAGVDTSGFSVKIDGTTITGLGASYNPGTKQFTFTPRTPLTNGSHTLILTAGSTMGGMNSDTVTFITQAGFVQITSQGGYSTRNPLRQIRGVVQDTSIHLLKLVRNDLDTTVVSVVGGSYVASATLTEGTNTFRAVVDSGSSKIVSDSVTFTYVVNHAPSASIAFINIGSQILLSAQSSSDPDSGQTSQLSFQWTSDVSNPQSLSVANASGIQASVTKPTTPGEYYFSLIVSDPSGNKDTTRSFFTILKDGSFQNSTIASVPEWVKRGRVYEMFFKSLTPAGTINAALGYLPYLKSLGVNILWVMPIMENASPINNGPGPGYNISNFVKVAPEYGTNDDFKNFVSQAHLLGLKVILDVTPNHTSSSHQFAQDARIYGQNSFYWNYYEHGKITSNTNNLDDCLTADGFNYYCGFSDQLLNYNWNDIDARYYMTEVYKWWVKEFDIDGYRLDVYWGPRRRYGEQTVGAPLRRVLKHVKPDLYLLAEDDGTGSGTEVIYGDQNGGADSGYDWILYGAAIKPFYSSAGIEGLHAKIYNNNYYPGSNASTLRFLENHDEERIAYAYGSYEKTMPIGTVVFTAPGMPMLYSGQEVGFGLGINDFDQRRRGVINWNNAGKNLLMPHYQKLASIRAQFPAFSSQQKTRIPSGNSSVYSYSRPFVGSDGLVAVNVSATSQDVTLPLGATSLASSLQDGKTYHASDLYNDTSYTVVFSGGNASLSLRLPPYGSRVLVLSDTVRRLSLPVLVSVQNDPSRSSLPEQLHLYQNYPNPFNPSTVIAYDLPVSTHVNLTIYNILGKEVARLVDAEQRAGSYSVQWDGRALDGQPSPTGIYLVRLQATNSSEIRKLVLIK